MHSSHKDSPTTVTGSDRLARHLRERAADAALADGKLAWEQPDILPVGAFWPRLASELSFASGTTIGDKLLLSRTAVLCRWEALVGESFSANPLLQTAGAARSALDAWLLVRDWQLDASALAADPLEETRLLIEWGRRFERECAERDYLPDYAVPEAVLAALEQSPGAVAFLPRQIRLAGFMEMSPRVRQHWNALESLGVAIEFEQPAVAPADVAHRPCQDARDELSAVAAWTRAELTARPNARIGIVVPDLARRRAEIRRALTEALAPERLLQPAAVPLPFNFSLGEPLSEFALVADALAILSLGERSIEFATAARLCRSPYLGLEPECRLELEGVMRRRDYARFSLDDWQRLAAREGCAMLAETLQRHANAIQQEGGDALPSEWARRFSRWLDDFGWCHGRSLDSAEYQAREAWHELLGKLAELDIVLERVKRSVVLGWVNRLARESLFQPRAGNAPVQVLGLLEATGVRFDALWVMGMDDETLPASPRPNPFLPIDVQREKQLPNASAVREQAFARQVFEGLCEAAPAVTFSHAIREADAEKRASPLLRDVRETDDASPAVPSLAAAWFETRAEEQFVDTRGSQLEAGYTLGGTSLLQNQSHCPFRAFALHRLDAGEWPTPTSGPDARVRGDIVHKAMEALWKRWRSRQNLADAFQQEGFDAVLQATVRDVVARIARKESHRWTRSLEAIEVERLVRVLHRWFENNELPRTDFEVVEIEGRRADGSKVETVVHAGPLELRGKLDRVDRLADGSELIIDYKTGAAPKKNDFFGARPAAPQLPAYLLARRQAGLNVPAGIAVASLKTGREGLQGVMHVDDDAANTGIDGLEHVARAEAVDSWDEAIAHWEQTIHALGEAYAAGEASVDPLPGVCDYCHLSLFCRIKEQRELAKADGEDENDD